MLIAELFLNGTMTMIPSPREPNRLIGGFGPGVLKAAAEARSEAMESFRWIEGEWDFKNEVPATPYNPAYIDTGSTRFAFGEDGSWVCNVDGKGRQYPNITFDPLSKQWIYVLTRGGFGMLRSRDGWHGDTITFSGLMTMLGIDCDFRMTWTREGRDRFRIVNEERENGKDWRYIDEWRHRRK